ncbi:hypothetical protein DES43_12560 [Aquamicrobium defluvii]|uniref:Uncharacterized protein n=1 Tax=Aquamicrobium defluvii TaxID=69279 RepID=A0A4V3DK67_9HYPH|nr:hypothetical protein DES43_12560 [Aquamicrobium defluvii]
MMPPSNAHRAAEGERGKRRVPAARARHRKTAMALGCITASHLPAILRQAIGKPDCLDSPLSIASCREVSRLLLPVAFQLVSKCLSTGYPRTLPLFPEQAAAKWRRARSGIDFYRFPAPNMRRNIARKTGRHPEARGFGTLAEGSPVRSQMTAQPVPAPPFSGAGRVRCRDRSRAICSPRTMAREIMAGSTAADGAAELEGVRHSRILLRSAFPHPVRASCAAARPGHKPLPDDVTEQAPALGTARI